MNYIGILKEDMEIYKEEQEMPKDIINEPIEIIKIENISYEYEKNKEILNNISIELKKGINIIEGKSGQGKSTLIKLICGILEPKSGNIYFNNININNKNVLSNVSYMCQNDFIYDRSVSDNIFLSKFLATALKKS